MIGISHRLFRVGMRGSSYKNRSKFDKIDSRGSKIDYDGTIRTVFDLKITFPTCVRVKNITFDQFLKIFTKFQKMSKK